MTRFAIPLLTCLFLPLSATASDITYEDRQAVLDLISRHNWALDRYDTPLLVSLFTEDAVSQRFQGGELVAEARTAAERLYDYRIRDATKNRGVQSRHHTSNVLMEIDENGDIRVLSTISVTYQQPEETNPMLVYTGWYEFTVTLTASGWKFSRLELHVDNQ